MQPKNHIVFALVLATFMFAGCGNETSTPTSSEPVSQEPSAPVSQEDEGRMDPSASQEETPAGGEAVSETPAQKDEP